MSNVEPVHESEPRRVLDEFASRVAPDFDWSPMELVQAEQVVEPFQRLLVHTNHMTTTLAGYHGDAVSLRVLRTRTDAEAYARVIQLLSGPDEHVVEFGIMRFDLSLASPAVRDAVNHARTPLGDILIQHDVMRVIEPRWFLSLAAGQPLLAQMGLPQDRRAFGRIGCIHCDGKPAIDLLEVVTDVRAMSHNGDAG